MRRGAVSGMLMLFCFSLLHAQGADTRVSCHVRDMPFTRFASDLVTSSGTRIFFREDWVRDIRVTLEADSITLYDALVLALQGSDLVVSPWDDRVVILPGEKLISLLPDFTVPEARHDTLSTGEKDITASEERYLIGRLADVIESIRVGKEGGSLVQGKASLLGRILDQETGEPMSFATLYISETGVATAADVNGYVTLLLKPGTYNILFEFLGYKKERYALEVLSNGEFTVQMKKAVIQMQEFIVLGDRQQNVKMKDPGFEKISMKKVKELPMIMGERNILQISTLLPGIVTTGEGSSGLNVRGGGSDQNVFYLARIPVYNTAHLFGFFPAFNADVIRDFSIYKGYVPASYGGRLSSVFTINPRQGNLKHFSVHGGVSPITGNITLEGPVWKDACSFIISGRSSYSDWILRNIQNPDIRHSAANFNDFAGGLQYDAGKTQLAFFGYQSHDHFRLADLNTYAYQNTGASLSFTRRYSPSLRGEYSLVASRYRFQTTDTQLETSAYQHDYQLNHTEGRAEWRSVLSEKNTLDAGAGMILYQLDRGKVKPYGDNSIRTPVDLEREQGLEASIFVSDAWQLRDWLSMTIGLRYSLYMPLGGKIVYTYIPGAPRDDRFVEDTLHFRQNQAIRQYHEPDARLSINAETDEYGSVKFAYNRMHQNLFLLNNTPSVAPNAQWKLADYHLRPSVSDQVSMGIFRLLPQKGLEVSMELFYKYNQFFPEFRDGAEFLGSPRVETEILQGIQKAYGVEFLLKRNNRKLEGWLSYTWSRSSIRVDGPNPWDKINQGIRFPSNYDIPHVVNLVCTFHFTRRITASSIISYQSGKPVTFPVSVYYVDGVPTLDYSGRNAYRIPDYFRADLSLTLEGSLRKAKFMHSSFVFSLYNLTGRDNPYAVYFQTGSGRIKSYQYAVIGVPVFTASWIFKMGNYAAE